MKVGGRLRADLGCSDRRSSELRKKMPLLGARSEARLTLLHRRGRSEERAGNFFVQLPFLSSLLAVAERGRAAGGVVLFLRGQGAAGKMKVYPSHFIIFNY
jgi:hypothetical protein